MSSTVLLIEDEAKLRQVVRAYFEREGLQMLTAGTGAEGLSLARSGEPDLVILDLGLPDIPGEEVARELRREADTPIILLTARAGEEDRIRGFELGADDYVAKPFSPRELVLRAQAILRRARGAQDLPAPAASFGHGELLLDQARRQATVRGQVVELTPSEWGYLNALAAWPGRVYSRLELANRVRGYEYEGYERTVDSHIRNLRRKIEADVRSPRIIVTVMGGGYRLGLARDR